MGLIEKFNASIYYPLSIYKVTKIIAKMYKKFTSFNYSCLPKVSREAL